MVNYLLVVGSRLSMFVLALQGRDGYCRVELSGGNRRVPQQFLHHSNVRAMSEHVRGATVAKYVRADSCSVDTHHERPSMNNNVDSLTRQRPPARVHEHF